MPITVTPSGILTFFRLAQPLNVLSPIVFRPAGSVIAESALQPLNASAPMVLSAEAASKPIDAKISQVEKARSPMVVTLFGIVMFSRLSQFVKAHLPMDVTFVPNVTLLSLGHSAKASCSIVKTLSGSAIDASFLQPEKACFPIELVAVSGSETLANAIQPLKRPVVSILVTVAGIVTLVRLSQPKNVLAVILVTEGGMVIDFSCLQPEKAPFHIFASLLVPEKVIVCRFEQSLNAYVPIPVTLAGISICVKPVHPEKEFCAISVSDVGSETLNNPMQPLNMPVYLNAVILSGSEILDSVVQF